MSASQDKKRRQTERMEGTDKRTLAEREAAQKAKKERTRWGIVGAIIVVFAVVVILLNTNLFYSGTTAITIGDYKYTNADFQYYYSNAYASFMNSYGSYFSMFDTTQDLDDQAFDPTYITMFGGTVPESLGEDASWKDYFEAVAIDEACRFRHSSPASDRDDAHAGCTPSSPPCYLVSIASIPVHTGFLSDVCQPPPSFR